MDIKKMAEGTGQGFSIYAILVDNHCLVEEFVDNLDDKYQKHITHLLKRIFETGLPKNKERFRHIDDQIYELKTRSGIRILSFFAGPNLPRSLILTHGFQKPHNKILKREKKKAMAWYDEYNNNENNIVSG